jgi:hypothetical protein
MNGVLKAMFNFLRRLKHKAIEDSCRGLSTKEVEEFVDIVEKLDQFNKIEFFYAFSLKYLEEWGKRIRENLSPPSKGKCIVFRDTTAFNFYNPDDQNLDKIKHQINYKAQYIVNFGHCIKIHVLPISEFAIFVTCLPEYRRLCENYETETVYVKTEEGHWESVKEISGLWYGVLRARKEEYLERIQANLKLIKECEEEAKRQEKIAKEVEEYKKKEAILRKSQKLTETFLRN